MLRPTATALLALSLAWPTAAQEAADSVAPEAAAEVGPLSDAARPALAAKQAGEPVEAQDWMSIPVARPQAG